MMNRISISSQEHHAEGQESSSRPDSTTYMLGQDVSNSILPFRSMQKSECISIECSPEKRSEVENKIRILFHTPYESVAPSATDSIIDFLRNSTHSLVYYNHQNSEFVEEQFDESEIKR